MFFLALWSQYQEGTSTKKLSKAALLSAYKKSHDGATFFGNWMRQSKSVINDYKKIKFTRVIAADNYVPDELNKFANLEHIPKEIFKNIYNLS